MQEDNSEASFITPVTSGGNYRTCVLKGLFHILTATQTTMTEAFRDFTHSLQASVCTIPEIGPRPLLSHLLLLII